MRFQQRFKADLTFAKYSIISYRINPNMFARPISHSWSWAGDYWHSSMFSIDDLRYDEMYHELLMRTAHELWESNF